MRYIVKVGYNKYEFKDVKEAVDFSMIAKTHNIEEDRKDRTVTIQILDDEEEER